MKSSRATKYSDIFQARATANELYFIPACMLWPFVYSWPDEEGENLQVK